MSRLRVEGELARVLLAPPTQADILARAVAEGWPRRQLEAELRAWSDRSQTRRLS